MLKAMPAGPMAAARMTSSDFLEARSINMLDYNISKGLISRLIAKDMFLLKFKIYSLDKNIYSNLNFK